MNHDDELKRTPLYDQHAALGGKLVPFAGWELPVQYPAGVIAEHQAVRNAAGLFDVSHMGEILVTGKEAELAISSMTCNDLSKIENGRAQYNAIINPNGGVVDDIIVYRYSSDRFFICVNASNAKKDFAWFNAHNHFKAHFTDLSTEYGQVALQGPKAAEVVGALRGGGQARALSYFSFADVVLDGISVIAARTGYTGEDGFEFFVKWSETPKLWELLLEKGRAAGVAPAGLGARDSLRLEACYPLHGHELSDEITAIESGLGWIVKPEKGEFTGSDILAAQKAKGAPRSLIGFFLDAPGISRQGDKIFSETGAQIGAVTSGTKTPTVNRALGMALVDSRSAEVGTRIEAEVRGKRLQAHVVKKPFYKRA